MTPTPDIEPIREGLARELVAYMATFPLEPDLTDADACWEARTPTEDAAAHRAADACLTYLIKRQAFLYDVYERIIGEMK